MTEDQSERETVAWLADMGCKPVYGPDIAPDGLLPECDSYRQVILTGRLRAAIDQLNLGVPLAARDDALKQVMDLGILALLPSNRRFLRNPYGIAFKRCRTLHGLAHD